MNIQSSLGDFERLLGPYASNELRGALNEGRLKHGVLTGWRQHHLYYEADSTAICVAPFDNRFEFFDKAYRHVRAYLAGDEYDSDSGRHALAHAAADLLIIVDLEATRKLPLYGSAWSRRMHTLDRVWREWWPLWISVALAAGWAGGALVG